MDRRPTLWLTGLPASGKRALGLVLVEGIRARGHAAELIDSGNLRRTPLGSSLGFSREERDLNAKRHALAARLLSRNGVFAVVSAITPFASTRRDIRAELDPYYEVYVATPPDACAARDRSGNWASARAGTLRGFTGVDAPFEEPLDAEARVDLSNESEDVVAARILADLEARGLFPEGGAAHLEDEPLLGAGLHELGD